MSAPVAAEARMTTAGGHSGLTSAEAARRLRTDGPNVLPAARRSPLWVRLVSQMVHFFALLLWVAGALAFVAGMPQLGSAIFVVVVVNGLFAFVQEYRADQAAERLKDLLPARVSVRRDDVVREIDAPELVVGDLVLLGPGDRVAADLDVVEAHAVSLDTSTLTGESVPAPVVAGGEALAGTFVVTGEGEAVVRATGKRTRLAGIATLTTGTVRPRSPLAAELNRVVRAVAVIAVGVGIAFFFIAWLIGTPAGDGLLFAIGVTVALVPEGLLPTVTLSLAMGAQRMANQHALVRRLESVETLGSTTFICTDKTGTLTRNEMSVVEVWVRGATLHVTGTGYEPEGRVLGDAAAVAAGRQLGLAALRCSMGRAAEKDGRWIPVGDPMEAAIDVFARRVGIDRLAAERTAPVTRRFPFDPGRRRQSVVAGGWLLLKGAPDAVLPRCTGGAGPETPAHQAMDDMAARGLRVLAVARRPASVVESPDPEEAEQGLELLGLLGLEDPPRPEAADAIAACRKAGIRLAMITGDHPATAAAVAREVGLAGPEGLVLEGSGLPEDNAVLGALLDRDGVVVARVTPEDKLRIAGALQQRGHVVAMTGDGVNDGPALREADIGIAMGRNGTDVAREAADLVLLDDNFATIVAAVEHGRATFGNIRRFLTYHLTDNVAELTPFAIWALSGGRFPLALGVLQILFLDIGTDLLPALALGAEPPAPGTLDQPPLGRRLFDGSLVLRAFGVLGPTEAIMEMAAFLVAMVAAGWRPGEAFPTGSVLAAASGAAFATVVLAQCANAFACRSTSELPWRLGWTSNRLLVGAVAVELFALGAFLFVPPVADLLEHAGPPLAGAGVAVLAVPAVLAADALHKRLRSRRSRVEPAPGSSRTQPLLRGPGRPPSP